MTNAQDHINTQFNNKEIETEIEVREVFINSDIVNEKTTIADKLTGELEIKDYPVLTKIALGRHEIEKLTIINCPNLKRIVCHGNRLTKLDITRIKTDMYGNPVPTDKLKDLVIGDNNELEEVSLEYCPELEYFCVPNNKKLDRILGLSRLSKLGVIVVSGLSKGLIDLVIEGKGLFSLPREWENVAAIYEKLINDLQEEGKTHLKALEISEVWNKRQKQELLDEIKRLKEKNQQLEAQTETYKKEIRELKERAEQQIAQVEVSPRK